MSIRFRKNNFMFYRPFVATQRNVTPLIIRLCVFAAADRFRFGSTGRLGLEDEGSRDALPGVRAAPLRLVAL